MNGKKRRRNLVKVTDGGRERERVGEGKGLMRNREEYFESDINHKKEQIIIKAFILIVLASII